MSHIYREIFKITPEECHDGGNSCTLDLDFYGQLEFVPKTPVQNQRGNSITFESQFDYLSGNDDDDDLDQCSDQEQFPSSTPQFLKLDLSGATASKHDHLLASATKRNRNNNNKFWQELNNDVSVIFEVNSSKETD